MRHNPHRFKGTKAILQGRHVKTIWDLLASIKTKRQVILTVRPRSQLTRPRSPGRTQVLEAFGILQSPGSSAVAEIAAMVAVIDGLPKRLFPAAAGKVLDEFHALRDILDQLR